MLRRADHLFECGDDEDDEIFVAGGSVVGMKTQVPEFAFDLCRVDGAFRMQRVVAFQYPRQREQLREPLVRAANAKTHQALFRTREVPQFVELLPLFKKPPLQPLGHFSVLHLVWDRSLELCFG